MNPPTQTPPASSRVFGRAFILEPRRSRALTVWWFAIHILVVASLLSSGLAFFVGCACVAAVITHAVLRVPPAPAALLRRNDGGWSIPGRGLPDLRLGNGTSVGPYWIALHFTAETTAVSVLLLRDQLDRDTWRALQAEVRRTTPAATI